MEVSVAAEIRFSPHSRVGILIPRHVLHIKDTGRKRPSLVIRPGILMHYMGRYIGGIVTKLDDLSCYRYMFHYTLSLFIVYSQFHML